MGTKILGDIHKDLKLLITAITGFENIDEGFRICERFVLSNIKHHRFLSIDGHATKRAIQDVEKKFSIHAKYQVAEKFRELVNTFLTSFDFERHPQYDLQWSLLSLLLNLSKETNKSDLKNLARTDYSLNFSLNANDSAVPDEIDWGEYLKEGQEEFFYNYSSSSESEYSDIDEDSESGIASKDDIDPLAKGGVVSLLPVKQTQSTLDRLSQYLADQAESRNWLEKNVQNSWWNELEWGSCNTSSEFTAAHLCTLWNRSNLSGSNHVGYLSEYQTCKEILWMFHAPDQMAVFEKIDDGKFTIRENVSIPSLTPTAFRSLLEKYCECCRMVNEIENFGKNLYRRYEMENKLPPLTYEAYNAAVAEHLIELRMEIVEIEKKITKQADSNTLLTLSRDLEKYMKCIKMIYEIHRAVTIDWREFSNRKCATMLLSGLYQRVQNSSSRERSNICASLYLSSLKVYLNIIATWLSEGRLEDWRNEFFITRLQETSFAHELSRHIEADEISQRGESFAIHPLDDTCLPDPVINLMYRKVKHMGRSIELLVTLDRISDMWNMNDDRDSVRISLYDEFLNGVTSEFSKYNISEAADTTDALVPKGIEQEKHIDASVDDNIMQQILKMDNPFLAKAFEEYLPIDLYPQIDNVDAVEKKETLTIGWGRSIFRKLEEISSSAILPFRKVLENALAKVLDNRYSCASKLVKDILVREYKLEEHLKLMRCIYMMERGHIMTQFYQQMFNEVESSSTWNNPNSLTCILQEVLSQEWQDSCSRWSINVDDLRTHQVLQAIDHVTLHYAIGWPVNMVLNEEALDKYNAVFRFQLKLKWALWTLDNLHFYDLEEKKAMLDKIQHFYARRLESLRFWLMHAIGSIHAYLAGQVLQGFGIAFEKVLSQTDNLDTIITVHNEYLDKVHEHCLQTGDFEDLMITIHNLLGMCVHVRDRWKRGASALVASDLDVMEASYTKYHTYIALALHNAVQHKDADYYKLTPSARCCTDKCNDNTKNLIEKMESVTELSRDLLTEVAHQSLPPSGIPIPVPTLVQKRSHSRNDCGADLQLPEYVFLNQYDQMFSYIRWYHYEEHFHALNRSPYDLRLELAEFVNDSSVNNVGRKTSKNN